MQSDFGGARVYTPRRRRARSSRNTTAMSSRAPPMRPSSKISESSGRREVFSFCVKVDNLSKTTTEKSLESRLSRIGPLDVHLKECGSESLANYAYVNCQDHSSAEKVIEELDNKLLDSNLVRAKLKSSLNPSATAIRKDQPSRDIATVKILIYRPHLFSTGEPLDEYFSKYGRLTAPSVFRHGKPDYVYLNFWDPWSAERCRAESPHVVHNAMVVAVPLKNSKGAQGEPVLAKSEYTCDPLVIKFVEKEVKQYFQASKHQCKVCVQQNKISLFSAEVGIRDEDDDFMKQIITGHQAQLKCIDVTLECNYLPALADQAVRDKLSAIQVPFKLQVEARGAVKNSFELVEVLGQAYRDSKEKSVFSSELKKYLIPACGAIECQWYWLDDNSVFQPYDLTFCEQLEWAYSQTRTIQEPIGSYVYEIDTSSMKQTNLATKKVRDIKRALAVKAETYQMVLRIQAHSDHIQDIQREIVSNMGAIMVERELLVPGFADDSDFLSHLLQSARQKFVSAEKEGKDGGSITLKGVPDIVKEVEITSMKEILAKQSSEPLKLTASAGALSVPSHWAQQKLNCELKPVPKESAEWRQVEQRMSEPGFQANTVRIERIQNRWQWEAFEHSRRRMSEKNAGVVNEKMLFHGSRDTPPEKIYKSEQGFDNRLASNGIWGRGAYFAEKASYSNGYAHTSVGSQCRQMFLVQVLAGITCKCGGDSTMSAPPKKSEVTPTGSRKLSKSLSRDSSKVAMFEDERYDSVHGVTSRSEVFVIYEHGKVYPAYLITYRP